MTYSTEYNEEKYKEIEGYLKELSEVPKGQVLTLTLSSPEEAKRLRWLFYDYFHIMGSYGTFKSNLWGNSLFIGRKKPTTSNVIRKARKGNLPKQLDSMLKELIMSPNPRLLISLYARDETISLSILLIVVEEYSRVMGK